ncbi:Eukaryotic aspartyl protease family protein [Perilla frutescens var. hirtella]|nr:Eukaryotic aspartyl protease family protein [Perilla frutescens var. hirtella]
MFIPSSTSSSSSSSDKHFQFLDVSGSLQHARQVVSRNSPHTTPTTIQQPQPPLIYSRSALPLSLISRSDDNYTSLTLSRLARDQAHVRSLLSRLSFSLSKHSNQLESPVISGLKQQSGEYFVRIGIGTPAAEFYMVMDTGSDVSWLQCRPCVQCYQQSDPIFNPSASSTYAPLSCLSRRCIALDFPACFAGRCGYQVIYGDASFTVGEFAAETISFGSNVSVPNVAIGCGHTNGGLFSGAAGLFGLGGGALSLPSQMKATSFSYCLVNRDSNASSTLDFNSTQPADSVEAPLLTNSFVDTYRYVGLSGISVGGEPVKFPSSLLEIGRDGRGGVIVDSGTTVSRLRKEVYFPVRDAFRNMSRNLSYAGEYLLFDTCYDLPSSLSEVRIPEMSFEFGGGKRLALPASNYMIPVESGSRKFCFAFAGTLGSLSIIGNVQQQGMRVTYDLANKYIAFSPNKC